MYNKILKLASAIRNDVVSGLRGFHTNLSMSEEQLCLDIVDERLLIIKEYSLKGIMPVKDLYLSINCISVDCKSIDNCRCHDNNLSSPPIAHFEIPLIINDYGGLAIEYIGSTDKEFPFIFYTSKVSFRNRKYRKRGKSKPSVWIDTTPNENGMYDCFIYNAPLIKQISITAIFKDLRQLEKFLCCSENLDNNMSFIDNEIKRRLTEKKIRYYRQMAALVMPNDLQYTAG